MNKFDLYKVFGVKVTEELLDDHFIMAHQEEPLEGSDVIFITRYGGEFLIGVYQNNTYRTDNTLYEGSFDVIQWKNI